ncbi:MAG TPA: ribonuclease HII [Candidatus Korarchaeota archaeon]|nr:ribonuclease HII [Candidatus Korarchaeota archaeon]
MGTRKALEKSNLKAGIDEAGRGAVIGPMVIACIVLPSGRERELLDLGVRDSKLLTPKAREQMYNEICSKTSCVLVRKVQPAEIDLALSGKGLNHLEARIIAELIERAGASVVYVDAPQSNPRSFETLLRFLSSSRIKIIAEPFADKKYSLVSAASIVAKVVRDREIERIKGIYGDLGSGYPSDPKTREFLASLIAEKEIPPIVRKSWQTYLRMNEKSRSRTLEDFT